MDVFQWQQFTDSYNHFHQCLTLKLSEAASNNSTSIKSTDNKRRVRTEKKKKLKHFFLLNVVIHMLWI